MLGAAKLTDSELLAIIIKTGTKDNNCLELAKSLLSQNYTGLSGFSYLSNASIEELKKIKGIGRVKAIQIKAVMEISKRINKCSQEAIRKITSPIDIYNLLKNELEDEQVELIKVVILNKKNIVKSMITISKGAQDKAVVGVKELLVEPLKQMASSIIIVHNHPSGDPTPSKQDINFTKVMCERCSMFDIEVLDHIIIGKNKYVSIKELDNSIFQERRRIL